MQGRRLETPEVHLLKYIEIFSTARRDTDDYGPFTAVKRSMSTVDGTIS